MADAVSISRSVEWRTCPGCGESNPWRVDVDGAFKTCRFCAVRQAVKAAVAMANAGQGTEFGGHNGGRR